MKIRSDFVTNSSSSSFIVSREYQNQTMTKELYDALVAEAIREYAEKRKAFLPHYHKYGLKYDAEGDIFYEKNGFEFAINEAYQAEIKELYGVHLAYGMDWSPTMPEYRWTLHERGEFVDIREVLSASEFEDLDEVIRWNYEFLKETLSEDEMKYLDEHKVGVREEERRCSEKEMQHVEEMLRKSGLCQYWEVEDFQITRDYIFNDDKKYYDFNDERVVEIIGKHFGYFFVMWNEELHVPNFLLEALPELFLCYCPHMG